jgi:predicted permease
MRFFRGKRDRSSHVNDEMNEEMRFHIEMEAADLERMGVPRDEARRRALATFGGVRRHVEEGREVRGGSWSDDLMRDIRYSLRALRRSPGYTAVVILTLALGIAANTSIFSVANGILFKTLPYRDPSRLMVLWDGLDWIGVPEAWIRGPEVEMLRAETKQFEGFAAIRTGSVTIAGEQGVEPQQVPQSTVSANFFQILGAGPEMGRGFARGEDAPGAPRVAVISRRLWLQRYGADRALLGKSIIVDGNPVTVVGVLPQNFQFAAQSSLASASGNTDVYMPLTDTLGRWPRGSHSLGVLTRVKSGVSVPTALAELSALSKRLDKDVYRERGFRFVPVLLQERMVREVRPALVALLGAVGMLIAIMCANLAVLALIRTARREHELTVRRAIGASQSRVARPILTESIVLAIGGAVVGSLLGLWTLRGLLAIAPAGLPRRGEIGIDLVVLAVTLGVAVIVGIGMALAPVMHSARSDIATVLREKSPSRTGGRVRRALVLAQLAMSMMLLAGTGLLLGSFMKLMHVDPGFDPNGVLTVQLQASRAKYVTGDPVVEVFNRHMAALRALPGVTSVGAASAPPLSAGADQSGFTAPTSPTNTGNLDKDRLLIDVAPVTADYFRTMGIAMTAGREFNSTEHDSASYRVVILDDQLAKRYFPAGNAVGQMIRIDGDSLRVVGVSRHVRMYNLEDEGRLQAWVPHGFIPYRALTLVLKTSGDPLALTADVRRAIHSVDPDQAIIDIAPMSDAVGASLAQRRLVLTLVGMFAGAALLLVALGIYGITASSVAQRTRELGIRMALGANRGRVIWNVLGEPTRLVAVGLGIGLIGTFLVGRLVQKLLYDVKATDPITLVIVSGVLLAVGALASYIPARRATRVDPMVALRGD